MELLRYKTSPTGPINTHQTFTSHNPWKLRGSQTIILPTVYVKSGLEQITSQRCAKENGMPPQPPNSHSHPYNAIGQSPTHAGRGWHTSETEEDEGGEKYLVLVLMKALLQQDQCQQLRCPRRMERKSYSRGVCTIEPQPERETECERGRITF